MVLHAIFNSISVILRWPVHLSILSWSSFNPFPNKPWFLRVCSTSLLKTPWEKEKLLVTSNSSFSHSVFYPFGELSAILIKFEIVVCKLFQFGRVQNLLFGKGLTSNPSNIFPKPLSNKTIVKTMDSKQTERNEFRRNDYHHSS